MRELVDQIQQQVLKGMEDLVEVLIVDFETNKALLQIELNPQLTLAQARTEIEEEGGFPHFIFVNKDGVKRGEKTKTIQNSLFDGNMLLIRFQQASEIKSSTKSSAVKSSYYTCEKGHNLFYLSQVNIQDIYGFNFYQIMSQTFCSLCHKKNFCRSICPQCSTKEKHNVFCADCRKIPCTRSTCPYEHKLIKVKHNNVSSSLICDFCVTPVKEHGPNVYKDNECNFDICDACFEKLPETHELVPFKTPKSVIQHLNR